MTISIDVDVDATRLGLAEQRALGDVTGVLLDLTDKYQLPATWAVIDPAVSAATARVLAPQVGHEIAILGDSTWAGCEAPRSRFGRELARRVNRARDAGLRVTTLALSSAQLEEHCDLAIKYGISAVRHARSAVAKSPNPMQPRTLQFGLWSFPVSSCLPCDSRWFRGGGGAGKARAIIDQAILDSGLAQLVIDAPRLAARGHSAARVLDRVLKHVDRRRDQGMLDVEPIGLVARRLGAQYQGRPSRSILLPAA